MMRTGRDEFTSLFPDPCEGYSYLSAESSINLESAADRVKDCQRLTRILLGSFEIDCTDFSSLDRAVLDSWKRWKPDTELRLFCRTAKNGKRSIWAPQIGPPHSRIPSKRWCN